MGSTGMGSFTDYSNRKQQTPDDETGGTGQQDICRKAFSTRLEDVERCEYYKANNDVPRVGQEVRIYFSKRIVAQTLDGVDIGYLPTKFNYINTCLNSGYEYSGIVQSSSNSPIPTVTVDIVPSL